ncbi:MAG: SpoIIE family protein phosphatase [Verrucomicrobia bacterium]|nr:SpoIIE family protein phosphatase [Verrucomicrobiota bacterium]
MADLGLSGKPPEGPSGFSRSHERFIGRLGFRVLFVTLIFLVIPLIVYSLVSYLDDYSFRKKTLFVGLTSFATGKMRFAEQMIVDRFNDLDILSAVIAKGEVEANAKGFLDCLMGEVARDPNNELAFFQRLGVDGSLQCTLSSEHTLIGRENLFKEQMFKTMQEGRGILLGNDPITGQKEILLSQAVYLDDKPIGVVAIGIDALEWLGWVSLVTSSPFPFNISILDEKGSLFVSQDPHLNLGGMWIFPITSTNDAQQLFTIAMQTPEGKQYLSLFAPKEKRIGVQIPIPGTPFYFLLDSAQQSVSIQPSSEVIHTLVNALLIFFLIGGGMALLITLRISRPLNGLCAVMQRVAAGDLTARYARDRMGFEINAIGEIFNKMIDSVIQHMEIARNERISREILSQELKIGQEIQRSILPTERPDFPSVDIASGFQGAKEVAGDFYDLFVREPGELVCAVADAAGKGISACLYSLGVRSLLRSFEVSTSDLSAILRETNNLFCHDTGETGYFVTAWVGILNAQTKRMRFSSCGHLPGILRRKNGQIEEITTSGLPLGVQHWSEVPCSEVTLAEGDVLILYTDGILDAQNSQSEFFGKERLMQAVREISASSAQEWTDGILNRVNAHTQGEPLYDDQTLLIIKIL